MRLAFLVVLGVSTAIALLPGPAGAPSLLGWDKLDHVIAFAALALLARGGWPAMRRGLAAGMLLAYGTVLEVAQAHPLVGRTASLADIVADGLGIAAGFALAWLGGRIARRLP